MEDEHDCIKVTFQVLVWDGSVALDLPVAGHSPQSGSEFWAESERSFCEFPVIIKMQSVINKLAKDDCIYLALFHVFDCKSTCRKGQGDRLVVRFCVGD